MADNPEPPAPPNTPLRPDYGRPARRNPWRIVGLIGLIVCGVLLLAGGLCFYLAMR